MIGATVGFIAGGVQGYLGAVAQNGTNTDKLVGGVAGAILGAAVGALDPTLGAATLSAVGATAGGLGDAIGQGVAISQDPCKTYNYGSTIGAALAGAISGYGTALLAPWSQVLGEWTSTTLANIFLAPPSIIFSTIGAGIQDRH